MPRLYVANCTPQKRVFGFRMLGTKQLREPEIGAGQQLLLGEFTHNEIAHVIKQHEHLGLFAAEDAVRARSFVHALWSSGTPVPGSQMKAALDRNLALKMQEGEETRRTAALSAQDVLQTQYPNAYAGFEVEMKDARENVDLELYEVHRHRRDGDYGRGNEFGAPLAKRPRRRKAA